MPRLIALRPGAVAITVDLNHFTYRLEFGAAMWLETPCFCLMYAYPPSPMGAYLERSFVSFAAMARVALVRLPVEFAQGEVELEPIARAANESNTLEILKQRTVEAFKLFLNNARIGKQAVDQTSESAVAVATVAWEIRDWIAAGTPDRKEWTQLESLLGTKLIGLP